MAFSKCPKCGQSVLSVASVCPKCGFYLTQDRTQEKQHAALIECRRCAGQVSSTARKCPYCGSFRPGKSFAVHPGVIAGLVVLIGAAAAVASVRLKPFWSRGAANPAPVVQPVARDTLVAKAPAEPPKSVTAVPPAATPRPPIRPPVPTEQRPAATPTPALTPPATPASTRTKWTATWANVRSAADSAAPVARVLPPRSRLEVGDRQGRWWSAYVNGQHIGYIASALLVDDSTAVVDSTR